MGWGVRSVGFKELGLKMSDLKTVTREDVLVRAFTAGGEPIAEAARGLVRQRSGQLHDSIGVSTELSPHQASLEGSHDGARVYVGPGPLPQAITEEFGTLHEAPHPFMRPAWESEQGAAVSEVARVMSDEVDKVARS